MSILTDAVVLDIDLVDQAEFVDIGRNFRIEHGLQRGDDFVAQARQLVRRDGRAVLDLQLRGFGSQRRSPLHPQSALASVFGCRSCEKYPAP